MASPRRWASAIVAGAALSLLAFAGPAAAAPSDLVGTFSVAKGACNGGAASGSYFRMILPTGTADGPFIENADSACADKTYTLFTPGSDGGLVAGGYQPAPTPGFDADGNSLATKIIRPVAFFGRKFSVSTNPTDLQVGQAVAAPVLRADGTKLTGDLTAFAATWNKQAFNQGAPKPGGGTPGNTKAVAGTYDAATGAYSLTWSSQIVGGSFDNFTGQWHLEGTFRPAGAAAAAPSSATTVAAVASPGATVPAAADAEGVAPVAASTTVPTVVTNDEQAIATSVTDDSFKVPTALVVVIALLGIAGVVVLVATDRPPAPEADA